MMRHRRVGFACALVAGLSCVILAGRSHAVSYSVSGSTYLQDFDSLPIDTTNNGSVEGTYTDGWQDDVDPTVSAQSDVSIPGWYLYHPVSPASENGFNGNQRFRMGSGANTGAFWGFGSNSSSTEKALGSVGSTTVAGDGANMYMGLRLTNNTGSTLTSFTVTYDGEQWRDGQSASPEALSFGYNLGATTANWRSTATYTAVPALSFSSPVFSGTNSSGTAVDGNTAGRLADITASVFGINWLDGQDLWLRWADPQLASNADDGLGIDNVRFTAPGTGPVPDINSAQSGAASSGSTWVGGNPPTPGFNYHVLTGHTVTIDAPFTGTSLKAETGGTIDIGPTGNGAYIPFLTIAPGSSLTESVSGDFALGDLTAPVTGVLELNENVAFTIDPGPASPTCDLCLNMKISGSGNIDINSAPGTSVSIPKAAALTGTINFNGTGDTVKIDGNEAINRIVMNSTGQNRLVYTSADVTNVTFNQTGIIDHVTTTASRLQGGALVLNAQLTINETTGYPNNNANAQTDERRFQTTNISGSGNVIVNGTAADYTGSTAVANFPVTLNEFEIGTTAEPTGNVLNSSYAGTITLNDYINGEFRHNLRRAGFVVNQNARAEFGFQVFHPAPTKSINVGEIAVNNGGTLEVGFEQGPVASSPFFGTLTPGFGTGHHNAQLNLTSGNGRSGGLTMTSGATLRMQINGLNADQFDSITATGNVVLGGATLDLLANPPTTDATAAEAYFPSDGDTFTLISIVAAPVQGDYDASGTVDNADYDVWRAAFGTATGVPAADGNNNGVVDAGDYVVWLKHLGQSSSITGSISGDLTLNVLDPYTSWTGFTIEKIITSTLVQIKFHQAGSGSSLASSVPEPSTLVLGGLLFAFIAATRRGRIGRGI